MKNWVIKTHKNCHNDELVAIMLLLIFGELMYPGISNAIVQYISDPNSVDGEAEMLLNVICVGVGGYIYDEHNKPRPGVFMSCARLVAEHLGIMHIPEVRNLIEWVSYADSTKDVRKYEVSTLVKQWHRLRPGQEREVYLRHRQIMADVLRYDRGDVRRGKRTFTMTELADKVTLEIGSKITNVPTPDPNAVKALDIVTKALKAADHKELRPLEIFRVFNIWQELIPVEHHMMVTRMVMRIVEDMIARETWFQTTRENLRARLKSKEKRFVNIHLGRSLSPRQLRVLNDSEASQFVASDYPLADKQPQENRLRCIIENTDDAEFAAAARSLGADLVIVQNSRGNVQVFVNSHKNPNLDLSRAMGVIRIRELIVRKKGAGKNPPSKLYWQKPGKVSEVPQWYYHWEGQMLLNGSDQSSTDVEPTMLTTRQIFNIIRDHAQWNKLRFQIKLAA